MRLSLLISGLLSFTLTACGDTYRVTLFDWYDGPTRNQNGLDLVNRTVVTAPAPRDLSLFVRSILTLVAEQPLGACERTGARTASEMSTSEEGCTWGSGFTGAGLVRDREGKLHRVLPLEKVGPLENGGGGSIVIEVADVE